MNTATTKQPLDFCLCCRSKAIVFKKVPQITITKKPSLTKTKRYLDISCIDICHVAAQDHPSRQYIINDDCVFAAWYQLDSPKHNRQSIGRIQQRAAEQIHSLIPTKEPCLQWQAHVSGTKILIAGVTEPWVEQLLGNTAIAKRSVWLPQWYAMHLTNIDGIAWGQSVFLSKQHRWAIYHASTLHENNNMLKIASKHPMRNGSVGNYENVEYVYTRLNIQQCLLSI